MPSQETCTHTDCQRGRGLTRAEEDFGGDDIVAAGVAQLAQRSTQDLLRLPVGVHLGAVKAATLEGREVAGQGGSRRAMWSGLIARNPRPRRRLVTRPALDAGKKHTIRLMLSMPMLMSGACHQGVSAHKLTPPS